MAACEACWTEASRRALTRGGMTADHYEQIIREHPETCPHDTKEADRG